MLPRLILIGTVLALVLGAIPAQAAKPKLVPAISPGPLSHRAELRATVHAKAKLTRVELRLDNKKVQPWVKAHAGWKYTIKYPLSKVAVGTHTVQLNVRNEKNVNTQRQWQFQKLAELALSADKTSVQPGEKATLTGLGFTPGTAVTVSMGGQNTGAGGNYASAVAGSNGSFTVEVTLDRYPDGSPLHAGTVTLIAHNSDSGEKASVQLRVLPAPRITLDKSSIKPGDQVRVTGEGFSPGVAITISAGAPNAGAGGTYGSAVTDATGRFALSVHLTQLPDGSPLFAGPLVLVAHTADSQEKASAQQQILVPPAISTNQSSIELGDSVLVTGQGFTAGSLVSISLGGKNSQVGGNYGTALVDTGGRFSVVVTPQRYPNGLPLQAGPISLVAHNASWDERASIDLRVVKLSAAPMTVQPGEEITLRGEGFVPGTALILSMAVSSGDPAGNFGMALVDENGRVTLTTRLTQHPDGSPLRPGPVSLVVHDPWWSQRAAIQIQIVERLPTAPSDLRITSLTRSNTSAEPTLVGLQWRDNSATETGFRIQASFTRMNGGTDIQAWTAPANTTSGQVSFVAGGINSIARACFTVTAFNGQGDSSPSNEVCAVL